MFVIVDYNTGVELGPASYEMRDRWLARKPGQQYIEHTICCCKHRVILKEKNNGQKSKDNQS